MNDLFLKLPQEKRNRIIQAAIMEFATYGYDNANTNRIAKRAHISVGSLFQYFDTKEMIFSMSVTHCADILAVIFKEAELEDDFFATIEKIIRKIFIECTENPLNIKLYLEMSSTRFSSIVCQTAERMEGYAFNYYCSIIKKGIQQGVIRQDCNIPMFAYQLDNLFIMLQYSFLSTYYQERFKIFAGDNIANMEDQVLDESMKFIKAAFSNM